MKILILNSSYPPNFTSGAERVVQSLAESLIASGQEVIVVTSQPLGARSMCEHNRVRVYYLPIWNVYRPFVDRHRSVLTRATWHMLDSYNPLMMPSLTRILDDEKPDVVNSHNITGFSVSAFSAIASRGVPIVHTLHDQYFVCANSMMYKKGHNCNSQCVACKILTANRRRLSRSAKLVIGVSRFILDRHRSYAAFSDVEGRVIYNSVSVPDLADSLASPRDSKKFRFGYLGRIHPSKGVRELVSAFSRENFGDAELWIAGVGDSEYIEKLKRESSSDENVLWLGHVVATKFLRDIDVLVVPSLWNDTAPLVVQEAFAHGIPVVGAKRGGISELVQPGIGWLYEPGNPNELQWTMRAAYEASSRIDSIARNARQFALKFSRQRMIEQYLDAYADVV